MKEFTEEMKMLLEESQARFIEINKEYLISIGQEHYMAKRTIEKTGEIVEEPINPLDCPLHHWHIYNKTKCPDKFVSLTAICPLCNNPMCPTCRNHNVHQLSRVTGYMSDVTNWNSAKKQEFIDRTRYSV